MKRKHAADFAHRNLHLHLTCLGYRHARKRILRALQWEPEPAATEEGSSPGLTKILVIGMHTRTNVARKRKRKKIGHSYMPRMSYSVGSCNDIELRLLILIFH